MHFANDSQKQILVSQKLTYRFSNVQSDKPHVRCDIIDTVNNEAFVFGTSDNEAAALADALVKLPQASRPSLALIPDEARAEIENLKKQLAEAKAAKPEKPEKK